MKNPNNHNVDSSAHLRRTTYDLSHSKHLSGKIGQLLPVLFQEVNAGEVFHWSPNFNFRFAPTSMPIQTRLKCVVDYFFVPMEAIWKDQTAFFNQGMNNTVAPPSHPWLKMSKSTRNIGVGSLGDYLGIPSAVSSEFLSTQRVYCTTADPQKEYVYHPTYFNCRSLGSSSSPVSPATAYKYLSDGEFLYETEIPTNFDNGFIRNNFFAGYVYDNFPKLVSGISKSGVRPRVDGTPSNSITSSFPSFDSLIETGITFERARFPRPASDYSHHRLIFALRNTKVFEDGSVSRYYNHCLLIEDGADTIRGIQGDGSVFHSRTIIFGPSGKSKLYSWYDSLTESDKKNIVAILCEYQMKGESASSLYWTRQPQYSSHPIDDNTDLYPVDSVQMSKVGEIVNYNIYSTESNFFLPPYISYSYKSHGIINDDIVNSPFVGNNPKIPLSPFGHRSYELCCNFFYRNKDVDPLLDANGHRIVNQFLPDSMRGSGADSNFYPIHYALLEKDIFTSCFTEPLVNYNPLIGIRQKNNDIFYDFATSGGVVSMSAGQSGIGVTETGTNVNQYTGAMITSYGEGIPQGDLNVFKDIIATGITNQDIYSAQCMQRWISNKVQKGYNFSEQQLAQFGVNSRWNPLTAPSYLGGTAEWINNGVVCNTAQSEDHALGELGGMPSCISNKENSFSYKASDRGFIIGIMRIVPIPIYSQAIHKIFTKQKYTDYFIPEFDNKGYEAVPKGELVPYLAAAKGVEKEAFGYQVPWYDYKSSYDTISGDMRTSFNESVIMRDFGTLPELSRQFIECRPEDYNNVFVQTKQSDKFIGEIFHNIKAERVIGDYQSRVFANVH